MGTMAETWHAEAVLRLVRFKFGDIPMDVAARVRNASSDALDAWLEVRITAEDIDTHRKTTETGLFSPGDRRVVFVGPGHMGRVPTAPP